MSAPRSTSESMSEAFPANIEKNACEIPETDSEKSQSQSAGSRLSLNSDFEEELKQYAAFSGDEEEENMVEDNREIKDEENQRDANKTNVDQDHDYCSDSSTTLSSVSSYEFRTKSKRQRTEGMTIAKMREAMDADLKDEPFDRSNWKPRKSIMERVAKRQRKEEKGAERASRRAARAAARKETEAKRKVERWAPY